jgi:hypothetical protein
LPTVEFSYILYKNLTKKKFQLVRHYKNECIICTKYYVYQETNAQNVKQKNPQQDYYITINDILTKPTKKSSHIYRVYYEKPLVL